MQQIEKMLDKPEIKMAMQKNVLNYLDSVKQQRLTRFRMLNKQVIPNQTLFVGSSSIEFFPTDEMQLNLDLDTIIYNRGINTETASELFKNIDLQILDLKPAKIFLSIGQNDVGNISGFDQKQFLMTYTNILKKIKDKMPSTQVYILSFFPINPEADFGLSKEVHKLMFYNRNNTILNDLNSSIKTLSKKFNYEFLNLNDNLYDNSGNLKKELSMEGLHMWPDGYMLVWRKILPYLNQK